MEATGNSKELVELDKALRSYVTQRVVVGSFMFVAGIAATAGIVLLIALLNQFHVLRNEALFRHYGLAGIFGAITLFVIAFVGLVEGAHRLSTTTIWARRATWLWHHAPSEQMVLSKKGRLLAVYAPDKAFEGAEPLVTLLPVRTEILNRRSAMEKDEAQAKSQALVKYDLFPNGAVVAETATERIWGIVTESAYRPLWSAYFKNELWKATHLRENKWIMFVVCLTPAMVPLLASHEAFKDQAIQLCFMASLAIGMIILHADDLFAAFVFNGLKNSRKSSISYGPEGELIWLAQFAMQSGRQRELDLIDAAFKKTAKSLAGEKADIIRTMFQQYAKESSAHSGKLAWKAILVQCLLAVGLCYLAFARL